MNKKVSMGSIDLSIIALAFFFLSNNLGKYFTAQFIALSDSSLPSMLYDKNLSIVEMSIEN